MYHLHLDTASVYIENALYEQIYIGSDLDDINQEVIPGWEVRIDPVTGKPFYYNTKTGEVASCLPGLCDT